MTRDSNDNLRATHERLLKAYNSLVVLINTETMFRYLDETLVLDKECPRTNNPFEGVSDVYCVTNPFWWLLFTDEKDINNGQVFLKYIVL